MKVERTRSHEGRDEMNLADFPISALQRAQKSDDSGRKLDQMEFHATRYDAVTRQRVQQKVTLTSTARDGLPTPADEHVILALLCLAKRQHDFREPTVHFAPPQLFEIMGWAPNGRSYTRLRDVLRRLQALTIRYENAWWDRVGRAYEEEVATGIIGEYRLARQVSGPRREDQELLSWVTWSPQFQASLQAGNLKRLDLDVFFKLQTPTAQRMYRFLDKRFYNSGTLALDLVEFACGHIGLAEVENVAILKRRLAPAIEELETIGFLRPMPAQERYEKVAVGRWRIHLQAAETPATPTAHEVPVTPIEQAPAPDSPAVELARVFYRTWDPTGGSQPGPRDLEQAGKLLEGRTPEQARALLDRLIQVTRKEWPDCRSLSGAAQKYLGDAQRLEQLERKRAESRERMRHQRESAREQDQTVVQTGQHLQQVWDALPTEQRQAIEHQVKERLGGGAPAAFVHRLCLQEVGRRLG